LQRELDLIKATLVDADDPDEPSPTLHRTLLYVDGRPAQIGQLRNVAERAGAVLLHHDGGIEDRGGLLPGLISRADAVLFPVDCIGDIILDKPTRQT
jgi:hypothetical protein